MADDTPKTMQQEMEERLAQEQVQASAPEEEPPVSFEDVVECMWMGEKGDGILFARLHQNRLLCMPEEDNRWLGFAGHYWEKITMHDVEKCVESVALLYDRARMHFQAVLDKTDADADDYKFLKTKVKGLQSAVRRTRTRRGISATVRLSLSCDIPMQAKLEQFDSVPGLLACQNGVIDLKTGELRAGRPQDYLLRYCGSKDYPVSWQNIDTPAPVWDKFISEIVESEAIAQFLQRLFGYSILGKPRERIFVVMTGEGSNGKSVLLKTLERVLGSYMAPVPSDMLLDPGRAQDPDKPTYSLMSLRGLKIAQASETDENRKFSTSRVKWFTGGDTLVGRAAYEAELTTFSSTHVLILATNHKPHAKGHESAFWDRLRLIKFPFSFVVSPSEKLKYEKLRDPDLLDKFIAELPGILAWLVKGALFYQQRGLAEPAEVMEATAEYRRSEDQMRDFVEECLEYKQNERTQAKEILDLYLNWWDKNVGGNPKNKPSKTAVGNQLSYILRNKDKVGGKVYYFDYVIKLEALDEYSGKAGQ